MANLKTIRSAESLWRKNITSIYAQIWAYFLYGQEYGKEEKINIDR
jgi:hypothetical protein